jgi:hypothetical protein
VISFGGLSHTKYVVILVQVRGLKTMADNGIWFDPNKLAIELCKRHEMHVGIFPGETRESIRSKAFSDTVGKLPDFIEQKHISLVDGLYIMQVFMRYRSGNMDLSIVNGQANLKQIATKQEWGLIQLLLSGVTKKLVSN